MARMLLSGREAAKRLKVSHQTVHNWIKSGKLQPTDHSTTGPLFDAEYIRIFGELLGREQSSVAQASLSASA